MTVALSPRWYPLRPHAQQLAYANSPHRFNVVPAGRRGGKTERLKRKIVRRALDVARLKHRETPRFFAGAPVRDQAKRIFWSDLKALSKPYWAGTPSESELTIRLITGAEITVLGLDKPERIEGSPWDGGGLDEYANMKPNVWGAHVRPALADRNGWCDLTGVPEGRNHYYDRYTSALAEMTSKGAASEWGAYTWFSSSVLPAEEIAAARADLDPQTFEQEYEASFLNFSGRTYYTFSDQNKVRVRTLYQPTQPLLIMLDFNVAPGVAVIAQELAFRALGGAVITCVIGEVWIQSNSNTPAVCRKLLHDWGEHRGRVEVYGDATGGASGTAKTEGSDWDLVKKVLRTGDSSRELAGFGDRVHFFVPASNPTERARVNAVNSRIRSTDGVIRLVVDPAAAPHVVKDLEGVVNLDGGSGEIDKKKYPMLTHISDALGYYVEYRYPVARRGVAFGTMAA